jgi:hypothetical protein
MCSLLVSAYIQAQHPDHPDSISKSDSRRESIETGQADRRGRSARQRELWQQQNDRSSRQRADRPSRYSSGELIPFADTIPAPQDHAREETSTSSSDDQERDRDQMSPGRRQAREAQRLKDDNEQSSNAEGDGQNNPTGAGTQTQPGQSGREYLPDDMEEIQAEQIPASLRRTLGESKYRGWLEHGTLYQDRAANEYVLVMDKGDGISPARIYRFDKRGQAMEDDGTTQSKKQDR